MEIIFGDFLQRNGVMWSKEGRRDVRPSNMSDVRLLEITAQLKLKISFISSSLNVYQISLPYY